MSRETKGVALVTGASSGIGLAFAERLSKDGYDLVVVARDKVRLEKLATRLSGPVEILSADLTDAKQLLAVEKRCSQSENPVDLLVNNAGFGSSGHFARSSVDTEDGQIRLNVIALMRLTHASLSQMIPRRKGSVINVASVAGFQPTPGTSTYGATKAFVISFTEAVHEEVRRYGIEMQVLAPGFTRTEFQERADYDASKVPSFAWMSAEAVVDHSLRALEKHKALCVPGAVNLIAASASKFTPRGIVRKVTRLMGGNLED